MAVPKNPVHLIRDATFQIVSGNMPIGSQKKQEKGGMKNTAVTQQTAKTYKHTQNPKPASKSPSMGNVPFSDGDLKNAVKFAQQFKIPEQFSKSFDMATNLLKTANAGKNILANLSVGGAQNISSALSAASAFQANTKKQNDANDKDPYEEFLKFLYKETTDLEPLDSNEKPTPEYKLWKTLYLASLDLYVSDPFLEACRAVADIKKFNLQFLQAFDLNTLTG